MKLFYFLLLSVGFLGFSQTENYTVKHLELNNEHPHFALMQVSNNKILFTSYLLDKKGRVKKFQGAPLLAIFQGEILENGDIQSISELQIDPEQNIKNITSATFSPDETKLYITTRYTYKNKPEGNFNMENFHIEVGEFKVGLGWTNFRIIPFCKPKYSYAHPTFSKDGKTLYFTANIRGGKSTTKGGSDIFKVNVLDNNIFSEPINLGSKVNSYGREMFPFMAQDNTLYFASNRSGGYGGFDIYKSKMNADNTFEKAIKLPKPINSPKDDFSLIINYENTSGYFSSKRIKGKGDDDIYYFILN